MGVEMLPPGTHRYSSKPGGASEHHPCDALKTGRKLSATEQVPNKQTRQRHCPAQAAHPAPRPPRRGPRGS